jgi:predicted GIY-YIG superfamily endonuclease
MEEKHTVYCLRRISEGHHRQRRKTYVGYTTDLKRRLRQHNGEITGGAKSTRGGRWEVMFYVTGFPNAQTALSCEKRFHLLKTSNRPGGIVKVLSMERWKRTKKEDIMPATLDLTLHCDPRDFESLVPLPGNVCICDLPLSR